MVPDGFKAAVGAAILKVDEPQFDGFVAQKFVKSSNDVKPLVLPLESVTWVMVRSPKLKNSPVGDDTTFTPTIAPFTNKF